MFDVVLKSGSSGSLQVQFPAPTFPGLGGVWIRFSALSPSIGKWETRGPCPPPGLPGRFSRGPGMLLNPWPGAPNAGSPLTQAGRSAATPPSSLPYWALPCGPRRTRGEATGTIPHPGPGTLQARPSPAESPAGLGLLPLPCRDLSTGKVQ